MAFLLKKIKGENGNGVNELYILFKIIPYFHSQKKSGMKKILFFIVIIVTLTNCSKVLDIPNLSGYDPNLVWNDPNLANAYLGNIYESTFGNWNVGADNQSDQLGGIAFQANNINTVSAGPLVAIPGAGNNDWTNNYTRIRLINQGIVSSNSGTLTDAVRNNLLGQFYFLRAYTYFGMVRTYGGVPDSGPTIPGDEHWPC